MKTIAEYIVDYLVKKEIKHVFGLCGHTNIAVLAALEKSNIDFVMVRHEQIASHAADGYARVTGKPAVVLSHLSPGLTNAATGVANAALDCIPMVVIAGDVPSYYYGKHPHQEVNIHADAQQYEIYRPFVKRSWRVDNPELMAEILDKAFQLAVSGQPGPVLVNVPMDIFSKKISAKSFERINNHPTSITKPALHTAVAEKVIQILGKAKNPVIYAGGGIHLARASEELRLLVDHLQIPVAYSLMGKGALSDEHPLILGMTGFWGTELVNQTCLHADWILALGTRFKEADCSSWYQGYTFDIPEKTKLIHIDIESSEIGRNYPAEVAAIADIKSALMDLYQLAKKTFPQGIKRPALIDKIKDFRQKFQQSNQKAATTNVFPMMPEKILADTREALPPDAIITTDVGWNKNGVGQQFNILTPGSVLTPGGFATMGFGPSAAIGAQIAAPEKVVISMVGDGGFGQNPAVLATAAEYNLPIIWLVMNNNAFGTIAGLEKAHYGTTYGTIFPRESAKTIPDYSKIAVAYGIEGKTITKAEELLPTLKQAIQNRKPILIDVPMINNPTPTTGHWNILDIYSPGKNISHSSTE